jgi:hypothetical protein
MIGIPLRFKTAVALVLLGLLTLLAGVGQKTIWAPAETVTASAPADGAAAPLTVIDQKLRTLHGGTVKINVKGEGSFMLAAGRPDDVDAWVGKTAHNTVSGVSGDNKALEMNYTWNAPADGEWSLLLASDGTKPAPSSISMTFPNDTSTPWAVPLMVLGGLLILGGLALVVLKPKGRGTGGGTGASLGSMFAQRARALAAARSKRLGGSTAEGNPTSAGNPSGPANMVAVRRSRGARTGVALAALAATMVAGTGIAAQASTTPAPAPSVSAAPGQATAPDSPVLVDAQFRRILEQVASTVDAGDAAKDANKLKSRVDKTELEVRTQNYKIRSQVGAYEARMPVRATKLLTTVVTSKRAWPRSVMAVTQGDGNVVPQLLTLVQTSPRENYKLVESTPLQPGTTFPAIDRAGTETPGAEDKSGLLYSGAEALAGLGDRLTKADSTFKDKLVEGQSSPYIADTLAYQADIAKTGVNGNFSFTHKVVPEDTVVFRTADGGALVLGRLNFAFDGTPKAEGDKLAIGDDAAALAGGKETSTGMVLNFAESMAVYIPPAGSKDPMKLVAATRGLVGASFK